MSIDLLKQHFNHLDRVTTIYIGELIDLDFKEKSLYEKEERSS